MAQREMRGCLHRATILSVPPREKVHAASHRDFVYTFGRSARLTCRPRPSTEGCCVLTGENPVRCGLPAPVFPIRVRSRVTNPPTDTQASGLARTLIESSGTSVVHWPKNAKVGPAVGPDRFWAMPFLKGYFETASLGEISPQVVDAYRLPRRNTTAGHGKLHHLAEPS